MKELEVLYKRQTSPIVGTIYMRVFDDFVSSTPCMTESGITLGSRMRLNQFQNFSAFPRYHQVNSYSAKIIRKPGESVNQIYKKKVFDGSVLSLEGEYVEEDDSHTEPCSESNSDNKEEDSESEIVLGNSDEPFELDDPRGIVIDGWEALAGFRNLIKYEIDEHIVYVWEKLRRAICPFLIQASVELLSFIMLLTALPKGFTHYALTEIAIAWPLRMIYVLLVCSMFSSVASLSLVFSVCSGLFGKRWAFVCGISFVSVLVHIYGCVYMIGSVIHIMNRIELLMKDEMFKGFNSSMWAATQQFLGCCGMTNYLSWNAIKNYTEQVPIYPQSCCDTDRWHCDKPPIARNVFQTGCLEMEIRMFTGVGYAIFWLFTVGVFYSGFVTYLTFKFHTRSSFLKGHRDGFISFTEGKPAPKFPRRHSEPTYYYPPEKLREVLVSHSCN